MTNAEKVKLLYANLGMTERDEVKKFVEEFEKTDFTKKQAFRGELESVKNKWLGPTTSSARCTWCGK